LADTLVSVRERRSSTDLIAVLLYEILEGARIAAVAAR
jgi:hypothetical protein